MIWCLEDDASIREIVLYTLASTGFAAKGFEVPTALWDALKDNTPELILLDIMLPGEDGIQVLKKLKSNPSTADIPVIMATAKGMEFDKVNCLEIGADDYLVKPFGMMELVARIKTVLRRSGKSQVIHTYTLGQLVMNIDEHSVTVGGKLLNLTFKEFELLRMFLANPRQVFSREQLFEKIWGSDYMGESRTVDMHIKTLRQKLGAYGAAIRTVRNVGYRLEEKEHDG